MNNSMLLLTIVFLTIANIMTLYLIFTNRVKTLTSISDLQKMVLDTNKDLLDVVDTIERVRGLMDGLEDEVYDLANKVEYEALEDGSIDGYFEDEFDVWVERWVEGNVEYIHEALHEYTLKLHEKEQSEVDSNE